MSTDDPDNKGADPRCDAVDQAGEQSYIDDPDFDGSVESVKQHYRTVKPVYESLAQLGEYPTTGFIGNSGWYKKSYRADDDCQAVLYRRAYTFEEDYDELVRDGIEYNDSDSSWRSAYNIASWNDRQAVYDGIEVSDSSELGQGDGLAGFDSLRGFPLWVDLDLEDNNDGEDGPNYKQRRGDLEETSLSIIEEAYQAYTEEFADLLGTDPGQIAVFDSGGGGYLYTPAAVTIPISERYEDDQGVGGDARSLIFKELRKRMFAYGTGTSVSKAADDYGFTGIAARVNDRVEGADELLSPDWMQNRNRQSKAPLAIHADHDVVVTPARPAGDAETIRYHPTKVSDVDDDLIAQTCRETAKIVNIPDQSVMLDWADSYVSTLFPEFDTGDWRETLDDWLAVARSRSRSEIHRQAVEKRRQQRRLEQRTDRDSTDGSSRTAGELLTEIDVTPVRKDVFDVLEGATTGGATFDSRHDVYEWWRDDDDELIVDVRDVIREYAVDDPELDWETSDRGHEVTFRPCWRHSESGESCAVRWVDTGDPEMSSTEYSVNNRFIDNGCDGGGGGGGPVKAYALGTGILPSADDPSRTDRDNAAAESLSGRQWAQAVEGLRADGYPIPIYIPESGSDRGDGGQYDETPLWALRKAAVALDVCGTTDFVEHETDDGESYLGFDAETYNAVLQALDKEGIHHGRDQIKRNVRSDYYEIDLGEYVDGDPWTDFDVMLRACLRARDDGAISRSAEPPARALIPLQRDVLRQSANAEMSAGTRTTLLELYQEISADDLSELLQ